MLLTAPAVALLRASLPRAHITYVVGPWSAEAARHGPPVDEVRTLAYPGFTRRPNPNLLWPYALAVRTAARLRREQYDLALVFRPDHWWGALLGALAAIPLRVASQTPETAPLLTHSHATIAPEHAAEQALSLARLALSVAGVAPTPASQVATFSVSDQARAAARALWARHALDPGRVIAIHPSAGAPLKSWPVEDWAKLANALTGEGLAVLLTGAPDDASLLQAIARRAKWSKPVCGQSLEVSAAIYERCDLVVAVDGGAAHRAAAVGTPTIRLYGPAQPETFGPWPPRADQHVLLTRALACAPCGNLEAPPCGARALPACMLALSVDDVLKTVGTQLARA